MTTTYEMKCRSIGNPDFGQYAPVSTSEIVTAETLKDIRAKALDYIGRWSLGGGNWPNCKVTKDGKAIALMSYNGRFWTPQREWEKRKEITL